jgi:hypothetical protein
MLSKISQRNQLKISAIFLLLIIGSVTYYLKTYLPLHTDENWGYYEAMMVKAGMDPYSDFFLHRLPGQTYFYGMLFDIFNIKNIVEARLIPWVLNTLTLAITLMWAGQRTKKIEYTLVIGLFYSSPLYLATIVTLTSYAYLNFISTIIVILVDKNRRIIAGLFFGLFYLGRYLVDFTLVVPLALHILKKFELIRSTRLSFIPFMVTLMSIITIWGFSLIEQTFYYNLGTVTQQIKLGILSGSWLERFLNMRKEELGTFFYLYPIAALLAYKIYKNNRLIDDKFIFFSIMIMGIISFNWVSANDYPITKLIMFPYIAALIVLSEPKSTEIRKFVFLPLLIPFFTQNIPSVLHRPSAPVDICQIIDCDKHTLALNPVQATLITGHVRGISMELYSFAVPVSKSYSGLAKYSDIIYGIDSGMYEYIILGDRYYSDLNMGKIIPKESKQAINKSIAEKYHKVTFFYDNFLNEKFNVFRKNI